MADFQEQVMTHVYMNQRAIQLSTNQHWLEDGEIIEFTKPKRQGNNYEFEINNDSSSKFWFSQLSVPGFNASLDMLRLVQF